jgi:hypothetical protein
MNNLDRYDVPLYDGRQDPADVGKNFDGPQNPKDCKNSMPCGTFKKKDVVYLDNVKSLVNGTILNGHYYFDTWDSYDNTCYVTDTKPQKKAHMSWMSWNVLLTDVQLTVLKDLP